MNKPLDSPSDVSSQVLQAGSLTSHLLPRDVGEKVGLELLGQQVPVSTGCHTVSGSKDVPQILALLSLLCYLSQAAPPFLGIVVCL